jgi:hypothetical protein
MSSSSRNPSLEQLSTIKDYQYLSTDPGFAGFPILDGKLYIRPAISRMLGKTIICKKSEESRIGQIIGSFLTKGQATFSGQDLPLITVLEANLRRMKVPLEQKAEETIKQIFQRVCLKLNSSSTTGRTEKNPPPPQQQTNELGKTLNRNIQQVTAYEENCSLSPQQVKTEKVVVIELQTAILVQPDPQVETHPFNHSQEETEKKSAPPQHQIKRCEKTFRDTFKQVKVQIQFLSLSDSQWIKKTFRYTLRQITVQLHSLSLSDSQWVKKQNTVTQSVFARFTSQKFNAANPIAIRTNDGLLRQPNPIEGQTPQSRNNVVRDCAEIRCRIRMNEASYFCTVPTLQGPQIEPYLSTITPEERLGIRAANTSWFLKTVLDTNSLASCKRAEELLYAKSSTTIPMTEDEWTILARICIALLRYAPEEKILKDCQKVFFRYYIKNDRDTKLPAEYLSLIHILTNPQKLHEKTLSHPHQNIETPTTALKNLTVPEEQKSTKSTLHAHSLCCDVSERISFFRSSPHVAVMGADPNGAMRLQRLEENYDSSCWQKDDFSLLGFTSAKPWEHYGPAATDKEHLVRMCHDLATSYASAEQLLAPETLDRLCLVLLFILSSHTLQEGMAQCKKDFERLSRRFPEMVRLIQGKTSSDDTEKRRFSNFCKLYHFYDGSHFATRMQQEERPRESVAVDGLTQLRTLQGNPGERFSLWGFKEKYRELAGNLNPHFDLPLLISSLKEVRDVAVRESQHKKKGRTPPMGDHFTASPALKLSLPPLQHLSAWNNVFHDVTFETSTQEATRLSETLWHNRHEKASTLAMKISQSFSMWTPLLDFQSLIDAIQRGEKACDTFLEMFDDKGLRLLKDYVYPYCVLKRFASTPFCHPAAKFIGGAASAEEVASLGGDTASCQTAAIRNALIIMRPSSLEDRGGSLRDSVIHSSQIAMLKTMVSAIEKRKQVFICNETESGKTTMSKLAPQIVSFHVPMVVHVAPFPQAERGWKHLTQWNNLEKAQGSQILPHFWISASELAHLMKEEIPKNYQALLQQSFFLMDEYDSEAYTISKKREPSHCKAAETSSIQDEFFFTYGCQRIVNMSATPNLETFDNMISRYKEKLLQPATPFNSEQQTYYRQKIQFLQTRREEILFAITREWKRNITIKPLSRLAQEDPLQQIQQVFADIGILPIPQEGDRSFLCEMPRFVLTPPYVKTLHTQMNLTFKDLPSAILLRDSDGNVQAHVCVNAIEWENMSLNAFTSYYSQLSAKPVVICFYSQDSVGGDFGIFSHERHVKGQSIVYPGDILPSYTIFQNMRRQRTSLTTQDAVKETPPSMTPVIFYIGSQAEKALAPASKDQKKEKLLSLATATALHFSILRELSRLKMKTIRKKQQFLCRILENDKSNLQKAMEIEPLNIIPAKTVRERLEIAFEEALEKTSISIDTDVPTLRYQLLPEIIHCLTFPTCDPAYQDAIVQEHEAVLSMKEAFEKNEWGKTILKSLEPYMDLQKFLGQFFHRQKTCSALWTEHLQAKIRQKNDPSLHPIPSESAVAAALRRVRGNRDLKTIPDVDQEINPGPLRYGIKPLPSDWIVKSMLGATVHDANKVHRFFTNLEREAKVALQFQVQHKKYLQSLTVEATRLRKTLSNHAKSLLTKEQSLLTEPIRLLDRPPTTPSLGELFEKVAQYQARYSSYIQTISQITS